MQSKEIRYEILGKGGFAKVVKVCREETFYAKKIFECSQKPKRALKFYKVEKAMNEIIKQKSTKCHYILTSENFEASNALYFQLGKSTLEEYLDNLQYINNEKIMDSMIYILLEGLKEIQEMKIIHKDIKPLNLIIVKAENKPKTFTIKYNDFGISELFEIYKNGKKVKFHVKHFNGTKGFMAPEFLACAKNKFHDYPCDPRKIDVYALGVVIQKIIEKGTTEIRKNEKYLIFKKMQNEIETRPSLNDIFKEIDQLPNFNKEETFPLDSGVKKILKRRHMDIKSPNQNLITMCCLVKEIFVDYSYDNYNSALKKLALLNEEFDKSTNIQDDLILELKIMSVYLEISIITELDLEKAEKIYSDAINYFDKIENARKNTNFMLTYYTLIDAKSQIFLHRINENLLILNSEKVPNDNHEYIEKELLDAIKKKEDLLKNEDHFPASIFRNLNFNQNCISCYYSLCCIYWHNQEFSKMIDLIANKILKIKF